MVARWKRDETVIGCGLLAVIAPFIGMKNRIECKKYSVGRCPFARWWNVCWMVVMDWWMDGWMD